MGNLSSDWMQRQSSRVQPRLPEYLKTNCVQVVARSNRKRARAVSWIRKVSLKLRTYHDHPSSKSMRGMFSSYGYAETADVPNLRKNDVL